MKFQYENLLQTSLFEAKHDEKTFYMGKKQFFIKNDDI